MANYSKHTLIKHKSKGCSNIFFVRWLPSSQKWKINKKTVKTLTTKNPHPNTKSTVIQPTLHTFIYSKSCLHNFMTLRFWDLPLHLLGRTSVHIIAALPIGYALDWDREEREHNGWWLWRHKQGSKSKAWGFRKQSLSLSGPGVARSALMRAVLPGNLEGQRKQADKAKASNLLWLVWDKSQSKKIHIVPAFSHKA